MVVILEAVVCAPRGHCLMLFVVITLGTFTLVGNEGVRL